MNKKEREEEKERETNELRANSPMNTYLVSTNGSEPERIRIQAHYYRTYEDNSTIFMIYPDHEVIATVFNSNYIKKL